jgi:hypothetical protein
MALADPVQATVEDDSPALAPPPTLVADEMNPFARKAVRKVLLSAEGRNRPKITRANYFVPNGMDLRHATH